MLHEDSILLQIENLKSLCDILNISENKLKYLLFVKQNKYNEFEIPKKSGGVRKILAPTNDLKIVQQKLARLLMDNYEFLDVQHGFIKNRSCVTNANLHINRRFILNIDLEDFFDTIHFGRVRGLFMNKPFNYNKEVATYIAMLVCYDGKLPQGAPTSPVISNIVCYKMDRELEFLAKKNRCIYTRYADDITFSTNSDRFPSQIAYKRFDEVIISNKIIDIISGGYSTGFRINPKKTKLSKKMFKQEVTGIVVNEKLNINKDYIKNIRAMLHSIRTKDFIFTYKRNFKDKTRITKQKAKSKLFNYIQGKLNYMKMVRGFNDKLFLKYAREFNELFDVQLFDVDAIIDLEKYVEERCFVIQSYDEDSQGTAFAVKDGLYTSTHIFINKTTNSGFVYDEGDREYFKQFPICPESEKLPFFKLSNVNGFKNSFLNYRIDECNYKSDVLFINDNQLVSKKFKFAKDSPKINDKVFLVGYPGFVSFNKTGITVLETKVISKSEFLDRKFFVTLHSPQHGMSGGPVLNEKREIVGIVYAGADLENDYDSNKVGFINLV